MINNLNWISVTIWKLFLCSWEPFSFLWLGFYLGGNFMILKYRLLLWASFSPDWVWIRCPSFTSVYYSDSNNNFLTLIKFCKFDSEATKVKGKTTCANFRVLWEVSRALIDCSNNRFTRWGYEWCSTVLGSSLLLFQKIRFPHIDALARTFGGDLAIILWLHFQIIPFPKGFCSLEGATWIK